MDGFKDTTRMKYMTEGGTYNERGRRATMGEIAAEDRRMAGRPSEGVSSRPTDASGRRATNAELGMTSSAKKPVGPSSVAVSKVLAGMTKPMKKAMGGGVPATAEPAQSSSKTISPEDKARYAAEINTHYQETMPRGPRAQAKNARMGPVKRAKGGVVKKAMGGGVDANNAPISVYGVGSPRGSGPNDGGPNNAPSSVGGVRSPKTPVKPNNAPISVYGVGSPRGSGPADGGPMPIRSPRGSGPADDGPMPTPGLIKGYSRTAADQGAIDRYTKAVGPKLGKMFGEGLDKTRQKEIAAATPTKPTLSTPTKPTLSRPDNWFIAGPPGSSGGLSGEYMDYMRKREEAEYQARIASGKYPDAKKHASNSPAPPMDRLGEQMKGLGGKEGPMVDGPFNRGPRPAGSPTFQQTATQLLRPGQPMAMKKGGMAKKGVPAHSDRPMIGRKASGLSVMPKGKR